VKQLSPNALRTHLARNQAADLRPDSPHPDADLLTAFAENALLDPERASILAHLAACPDCRTIVHTAADAEPDPAPQLEPVRPPLRAWLPGIALAASLIVMAASSIVFYRTLHTTPARTQTSATAPAPLLPAAPPPAAPALQISAATSAAPAATPAAPKHHRASSHSASSTPAQTEEARVGAAAPPPPPPRPGISSSQTLGDLALQKAQNTPAPADQAQLQADLRGQTAYRGAMAAAKTAPRPAPSSTQSVQVESSNAFAGSLQTTQPALRGLIAAPTSRPRFRITDSGQLERSVQSGIWMPVSIAPDAHFRVLSISGDNVWAGGDHLRLFHSTDNGLTWTEVQLPATADRAHPIVHIRIDDAQHLTVEDDTGATWTTTDAGATWQ
jgi:hypothetical protein